MGPSMLFQINSFLVMYAHTHTQRTSNSKLTCYPTHLIVFLRKWNLYLNRQIGRKKGLQNTLSLDMCATGCWSIFGAGLRFWNPRTTRCGARGTPVEDELAWWKQNVGPFKSSLYAIHEGVLGVFEQGFRIHGLYRALIWTICMSSSALVGGFNLFSFYFQVD